MIEDAIEALRAENDALRRKLTETERELSDARRMLDEQRGAVATINALFRALPDLFFRMERDGTIVDYRARMDGDLYVPPEVFLGKRMHDLLPSDVGVALERAFEQALASDEMKRIDYPLEVNGAQEWYEARVVPLDAEQLITFIRRTTEQRRDRDALEQRSRELEDSLRSLERAEAERNALQEQIIATQRATLRALWTPLVPIARDTVAVPLIGAIDASRAERLLEVLLAGVAERGASMVLLDVTGVPGVDDAAADAIARAARAVGLLGAELVLTGVGAEVARTLIGLGADLRGIVTLGSLEQGIAYAMGRKNRPRARRGA
ncbi:PAS domain-containing protein [Polyangium aurulentum]|uniref:PAS domain-containing protein n=1 Tax=Polyangium aurulentum TaxID=2567896 RepID=UPI00146CE75A|nr:PAS domain-containing protein [Polyangium aurulentum]UQA61910.1 PAS domain-containing protein [Polyangium aurulentum]